VRWIIRRGEYLNDAETAGIRFSGVIYDITEAKNVEEQLRTLNETLESRVEERTRERDRVWLVSRDVYALCDLRGQCRTANPAWQRELGYRPVDVQGRPLTDFVDPTDRATADAAIQKVARAEFVENLDLKMLCSDGKHRTFSWTFVPEGTAFFAAGRDVTERNLLEEQLRQAQKMEAVGQLTGGIAHDFNNLLTGITASLDLMRRRMEQGRTSDMARFMDAATTSAQRAAALTHRLLAFSRRQSLDVRALDVNKLIASMEDMLRRSLGEQINLSVSLGAGLWVAMSDANQLESALLNLAINARDAMPTGGTLTIESANATITPKEARAGKDLNPGDYVVVSVTDTGVGMPPDIVAKVFEPFFTTKPIGQGTGLGLSMIYGFAKQSGGNVQIESTVGVGTTISLYIPRFWGDPVPDATPVAASIVPSGDGQTILIVEDDSSVRLAVVELLTELGYGVLEATDSRTAIPLLQSTEQKIDLLVSDVGLPGMTGRHLAEIARQHRPNLKILFITGYTQSAALRSDFLTDGMDMILKPFSVDVMANKIREMFKEIP
jgi:PAS domain S-box-containing protein